MKVYLNEILIVYIIKHQINWKKGNKLQSTLSHTRQRVSSKEKQHKISYRMVCCERASLYKKKHVLECFPQVYYKKRYVKSKWNIFVQFR